MVIMPRRHVPSAKSVDLNELMYVLCVGMGVAVMVRRCDFLNVRFDCGFDQFQINVVA